MNMNVPVYNNNLCPTLLRLEVWVLGWAAYHGWKKPTHHPDLVPHPPAHRPSSRRLGEDEEGRRPLYRIYNYRSLQNFQGCDCAFVRLRRKSCYKGIGQMVWIDNLFYPRVERTCLILQCDSVNKIHLAHMISSFCYNEKNIIMRRWMNSCSRGCLYSLWFVCS